MSNLKLTNYPGRDFFGEPAPVCVENVPEEVWSDFRNFLYVVWKEALRLPEPSPLQYSIAYALQFQWEPCDDKIIRRQIQAMRGAGKTYILCALAVFMLMRNPDTKIMYIASNGDKAKDSVLLMRQIIDNLDFLHYLVPGMHQRDGALKFEAGCAAPAKDASVMAASVSGALTGFHPDMIISDDIETSENALTAGGREKIKRVIAEYESMVNPGGSVNILGTPHTPQSPYITIRDQYRLRVWPAQFPDLDQPEVEYVAEDVVESVRDNPEVVGQPTYPERFDQPQLDQKMALYGPYYYNLQMLCRTDLANSDRHPLKLRNLIVYDCDGEHAPSTIVWGTQRPVDHITSEGMGDDRLYWPAHISDEFVPYDRGLMAVDPSGGGDSVGYAVLKACQGTLYLVDAGGLPGGHSEATLTKLARIAAEYDIRDILVESNYGDGLYEKALQPIVAKIAGSVQIRSKKVSQQKERRICDTLEPVTGNHRLVVDGRVAKNARLMSQYVNITRDRGSLPEDDIIDAVTLAVGDLADFVQLDPSVVETNRHEQELRESARETQRLYYQNNPHMLEMDREHRQRERDERRRRRTARSGGRGGRSGWTGRAGRRYV